MGILISKTTGVGILIKGKEILNSVLPFFLLQLELFLMLLLPAPFFNLSACTSAESNPAPVTLINFSGNILEMVILGYSLISRFIPETLELNILLLVLSCCTGRKRESSYRER